MAYCNCAEGNVRRYGLDLREAGYTWMSYRAAGGNAAIYAQIKSWLERDDGAWLILIGKAGVGKTGLASLAYRQLIDGMIEELWTAYGKGPAEFECAGREFWLYRPMVERPYAWWHIKDLLDQTKADFDKKGIEPAIIKLQNYCELLALDDLGAERSTLWSMGELRALIYRRHAHKLRTIITSNLDAPRLKRWLDDADGRIMDRINETSVVIEWPANAPSLRTPISKQVEMAL